MPKFAPMEVLTQREYLTPGECGRVFGRSVTFWSQAFDALIRITALERAVADAKIDAERDGDFSALFRLKSERDAERRAVREGTVWQAAGSSPWANIH